MPMLLSLESDRINVMQWPIRCSHSSSIAHKFRYWLLLKAENSVSITNTTTTTTYHHTHTTGTAATSSCVVVATTSTIIETLSKPINSYYDMNERRRNSGSGRDGIKCKKPNDSMSRFPFHLFLLVLLLLLSLLHSTVLPIIRIQIHTYKDFETKIKSQNNREKVR